MTVYDSTLHFRREDYGCWLRTYLYAGVMWDPSPTHHHQLVWSLCDHDSNIPSPAMRFLPGPETKRKEYTVLGF